MKTIHLIAFVISVLLPVSSYAANTANATISCYSLAFQRGSEAGGNYALDLSSSSGGANGELALDFFSSGYTHSAYLTLQDDLLGDTLSGQMALDVPPGGDAHGDGFPDFFQVSQGITNLTSAGASSLPIYGNGSVTAVWNRPAGSSYGTCALTMQLLNSVTFYHTFQVLEYKGPLNYTPGTNSVAGSVNLIQTDNTNAMMVGPVLFIKSSTDPLNELTLQTGAWTNESQQTINYLQDIYTRDTGWPTNYYGYLEFTDPANPGGFYSYGAWLLSIDDLNDSNHNGIPDFSDVSSASGFASAPQLELLLTSTNLLLTLHGQIGYINDIQSLSDLGSTNWQTTMSVSVTNDSQVVFLPTPATPATFWRVRAR